MKGFYLGKGKKIKGTGSVWKFWEYTEASTPTEIMMREELYALYGGDVQHAHGIVIRIFDHSQESEYNDATKTEESGPKYRWQDYLVQGRRTNARQEEIAHLVPAGSATDLFHYYVAWVNGVVPVEGDEIYEVDWEEHKGLPATLQLPFKERYRIESVNELRDFNGRVEYYDCLSIKTHR